MSFASRAAQIRRSIVAFAVVGASLALAGCGHPVQRQLEGRWHGDSVENFDTEHVAAVTGWAKSFSIEFSGSSATVSVPTDEPRSGNYQVAAVHEKDVTLAFKRKDGSVDKASFKLDDERSMRWMVGDGRAIVMRRAD